MTQVIPSYLFQEYSDDLDLQNFVAAYNQCAQNYIDTINGLNLPIYTGGVVQGALLDWVAQGIYGMARPYVTTGQLNLEGAYATYDYATLKYAGAIWAGNLQSALLDDDYFRRVLTWHIYRGDGPVFSISWLKRRLMRFMVGANGLAPLIDQTYRISVVLGLAYQVNVTILNVVTVLLRGPYANAGTYAGGLTYAGYRVNTTQLQPPLNPTTLIAAVKSGVLELPLPFSWVIRIN